MHFRDAILLGWNASTAGSAAWQATLALARLRRARLVLHHVQPSMPLLVPDTVETALRSTARRAPVGRGRVARQLQRAQAEAESAGVDCESTVSWGLDVADALLRAARHHHCELIVLGTGAPHPWSQRLFGGIVVRVVRRARVSVLVVPRKVAAPGAVTAG